MKSDIIMIDNQGNGLDNALKETKKAAAYRELDARQTVQLQLLTEETLSMARSVTGEMKASFWLESNEKEFELHLTTKTVMDAAKREKLLSAATSRKNEITKSFLGKLRDSFEQAMLSDGDRDYYEIPAEVMADISNRTIVDPEWDGYERSVLIKLADTVKIGIRRGVVDMTIVKSFA